MNRDGSGSRVLTAQLDRDVAHPLWARDGSGIFFLYDERGNTKLGFTPLDGRLRTVASDIGGPGGTYGDGTYSTGGRRGFAITYSRPDRKSTRLNSSHLVISYAVFCLKKKKK